MAQGECIFVLKIILNEVPDLSGPSLKLSPSPDRESGLFTFQPE